MWEKQRSEEIKYLRAVQKEQKAAGVAERARLKREEKERKDKERAEMKWVGSVDCWINLEERDIKG